MKLVMGNNPVVNTKQTKHGRNLEPRAKMEYTKIQKKKHRSFAASDSGFIICDDNCFLGASPDLVVNCKCKDGCGEGLAEIKCPETMKGQKPTHVNYREHLVEEEGQISLKKESSFYYQIQGQMAITKRCYCDIFIYCGPEKYFLQRVRFDPEFWVTVRKQLSFLWHNYVAEELLTGSIRATLSTQCEQDVIELDHTYRAILSSECITPDSVPSTHESKPCPLSKSKFPSVFLCVICGMDALEMPAAGEESVECTGCRQWCHAACGRVTDMDSISHDNRWLCPKCNVKM